MPPADIQKRALRFSISIIHSVRYLSVRSDMRVLIKQLIRSGTSIGANIVEAQHGSNKKEFQRYIQIALRSARETEYWLKVIDESYLLERNKVNGLICENIEISKILTVILINSKKTI